MPHNVRFAQLASTGSDGALAIGPPMMTASAGGEDTKEAAHTRLQKLRIDAGYATAAEAARAIGVSPISYQHHENGNRGISRKAAETYGRHYGVPGGLILYGDRPVAVREVPVVGAIGAAGRITDRMHASPDLPKTTAAPPFTEETLQALIVQSDDLYPAYRGGDVVFFGGPAALSGGLVEGRECCVETSTGERLLRVCHADASGTWTLSTYQGPPQHGVALVSASPVLWVQRAAFARPN